MQIQKMFKKDINRDINGVVKVSATDEKSLEQELSEYVITKELRGHFGNFFERYTAAINRPTDKIGVWISGFFGSGKSHFLKMLSYILPNRMVCGKHALDYFEEKIGDATLWAEIVKAAGIPTEAILFNVDVENQGSRDGNAILKVFAKMFYKHCGYFGDNLKVVRLEQFLDKEGKFEEFKDGYKAATGKEWNDDRKTFAFRQPVIVKLLQQIIGMSEDACKEWFKNKDAETISVSSLVDEIKEYADSKGKNFRLLFMVDEIGQFIGDNGDLMLNLQSIVEEIGTNCGGRVWVMVTSQEDIDHIVENRDLRYHNTRQLANHEAIRNDFSKIQGRFNTRLSLTSASVAEVIKERVLAKNSDAEMLLKMNYEKYSAVLKNLYSFTEAVNDIKGFVDSEDFAASYPFIPYQFRILRLVFKAIREHGNSGKHLSGGERSMLSGFQEAAQKIENKGDTALVPFYMFYDTLNTFLEGSIREVIARCQEAADAKEAAPNKITPFDVDVLKLLYLIRYVDDFKANIDNISILMIDDIDVNTKLLKDNIRAALNRLHSQNYIGINGDTYNFLTNEEQDVAKEIARMDVRQHDINKRVADLIFNDIYQSKKIKYGKYDFSYDQYVDEVANGTTGSPIKLRIVTSDGDLYEASEPQLISTSAANKEAIIILFGDNTYHTELEQVERINKYVKMHNVSMMPESLADIVRKRQAEAGRLEKDARNCIEKAIKEAKVVVNGEIQTYNVDSSKNKIDRIMQDLVQSVYSSIGLVNTYTDSDAEIKAILKHQHVEVQGIAGSGANNEFAIAEIVRWLESNKVRGVKVSVGQIQKHFQDIPFGWKEIDIAAMLARLVARQKIDLTLSKTNQIVGIEDNQYVDYLRKKSLVESYAVVLKEHASEELVKKCGKFLREYLEMMGIEDDEEKIIEVARGEFKSCYDNCCTLLRDEYARNNYPGQATTKKCQSLMQEFLNIGINEPTKFLTAMFKKQDDLMDMKDDMSKVNTFFKSQIDIYNEARDLLGLIKPNQDYFAGDAEASANIDSVFEIIGLDSPYNRIKEIPEKLLVIRNAFGKLLDERRQVVYNKIDEKIDAIKLLTCGEDVAGIASVQTEVKKYSVELLQRRKAAETQTSITELDATLPRLDTSYENERSKIEKLINEAQKPVLPPEPIPTPVNTPDTTTGGDNENPAPVAPQPVIPQPVIPQPKIKIISRTKICKQTTLTTKADVDSYVAEIKKQLSELIDSGTIIKID